MKVVKTLSSDRAIILVVWSLYTSVTKFRLSNETLNILGQENVCVFRQKLPYISETVQDSLSTRWIHVTFDDFTWRWKSRDVRVSISHGSPYTYAPLALFDQQRSISSRWLAWAGMFYGSAASPTQQTGSQRSHIFGTPYGGTSHLTDNNQIFHGDQTTRDVISRPWSWDSSALEFILSRSRSRDLKTQFSVLVSRPKKRSSQQHCKLPKIN